MDPYSVQKITRESHRLFVLPHTSQNLILSLSAHRLHIRARQLKLMQYLVYLFGGALRAEQLTTTMDTVRPFLRSILFLRHWQA